MIITKEFLMEHRTIYNAWTKKQTSVLGLTWPLKAGWINQVIGNELNEDQVNFFIQGKNDYCKSTLKKKAKLLRRLERERQQ